MNDQSPWGKKKKPGTPEDFLAALIQKIRDAFNEEGKEGPPSKKKERRGTRSCQYPGWHQ
jgi:membrane protease subunit HflK